MPAYAHRLYIAALPGFSHLERALDANLDLRMRTPLEPRVRRATRSGKAVEAVSARETEPNSCHARRIAFPGALDPDATAVPADEGAGLDGDAQPAAGAEATRPKRDLRPRANGPRSLQRPEGDVGLGRCGDHEHEDHEDRE